MLTRFLTVVVFLLAILATFFGTLLLVRGPAAGGGNVDAAIASYLDAHPEAVVNAFAKYRSMQMEAENRKAGQAIREKKGDLEDDKNTPHIGNQGGDVTLVMFSDYNCGFCKRAFADVLKLINDDGKIRLAMKDFPILGPRSVTSSTAALAFYRLAPDKYLDFHSEMLRDTPKTDEQLFALAEKHGVATDALKTEMQKPEIDAQLQKNLALGQSIGVQGTPAFVLNGELIRGAIDLESLRQKVADARSGKKPEAGQ